MSLWPGSLSRTSSLQLLWCAENFICTIVVTQETEGSLVKDTLAQDQYSSREGHMTRCHDGRFPCRSWGSIPSGRRLTDFKNQLLPLPSGLANINSLRRTVHGNAARNTLLLPIIDVCLECQLLPAVWSLCFTGLSRPNGTASSRHAIQDPDNWQINQKKIHPHLGTSKHCYDLRSSRSQHGFRGS